VAETETAVAETSTEPETATDSGSVETSETADALCVPSCSGKECGSDGCGGSCGGCEDGTYCWLDVNQNADLYYGSGLSCDESICMGEFKWVGWCGDSNPCTADICTDLHSCGHVPLSGIACNDGDSGTVNDTCADGMCVGTPTEGPMGCVPSCSGKECGDDGCGGSCGTCGLGGGTSCTADWKGVISTTDTGVCISGQCEVVTATQSCTDGDKCTADSCDPATAACVHAAKVCGDGDANTADSCNPVTGACVFACVPSCSGKVCGPDGCGGICGSCLGGLFCDEGSAKCLAPGQCSVSAQCDGAKKEICYGSFCATDTDGDGVPDGVAAKDNCPTVANADQKDGDGDGWGDACDCGPAEKSVHPFANEICSNGVNEDCDGLVDEGCPPDADKDGVTDAIDNCPLVANSDQADLNKDGFGEACEVAGPIGITLPIVVHKATIQGWLCVGGTDGVGCKAWTPWGDLLSANGIFAEGFDLLGLTVSLVQPSGSEMFFDYRLQETVGGPSSWLCTAPPAAYAGPKPVGPDGKPFGLVPNGQGGCNFVRKM